MTGFRTLAFATGMWLTAAIPAPAIAQATPEIVGEWHGHAAVASGDQMMALTVTRGADGTLAGEFENRDAAPGRRAPVSEIVAANGRLTFRIAPLNISYEAQWDETAKQWRGTLSRGATALNFSRGLPPVKPRIDGIDGLWQATIMANGTRLRQVLRISSGAWGTNALMDSPDQYVSNMVVTDLARDGQLIRFAMGKGSVRFEGVLSQDGEALEGVYKAAGSSEPISFARLQTVADRPPPNRPQEPKGPLPYAQEEVTFDNAGAPGIRLSGTLTLPPGKGPFPTAILIAGTGQHDRDETLDGHKPFLVIADQLTRKGIAVLRFDERGAGKSTGAAADATSGDKASDANAAFAYLLTRPDIRKDAIGFIGHSEGGLVGPIAMAENGKVAFLVSLAGPAVDMVDLVKSQRRIMAGNEGASAEMLRRTEGLVLAMWAALAKGQTPQAGREALFALMTPEAKATLGVPPETDSALLLREMLRARTWYLARYDPVPTLARITVPVLVLSGDLDRQTEPQPNLDAWRKRLTRSKDVTVKLLPGLNHMFQHAKTGGRGEYRDIEETFDPATLTLIGDWINTRFGKK